MDGVDDGRTSPRRASILVGETCYNCRAALDYLVYALTVLDTRGSAFSERVPQFPIESDPAKFAEKARPGGFVGYLTAQHKAMLETLQPYQDCTWTRLLVEVSDPDKHRQLVALVNPAMSSLNILYGDEALAMYRATVQREPRVTVACPDGRDAHIYFTYSVFLAFCRTDGAVLPALRRIISGLHETLEMFRGEF